MSAQLDMFAPPPADDRPEICDGCARAMPDGPQRRIWLPYPLPQSTRNPPHRYLLYCAGCWP